jgi:hypothetical protein
MNTINFYDKKGNLLIQFYSFQFIKTEALKIITFIGKVDFDFFHFETKFQAEEYDFRNLLISLKKMYNGQLNYISFNPLYGKILVNFAEEKGQIEVNIEISNELSTGKLEFKYDIDQSFIPELIKEIENLKVENN